MKNYYSVFVFYCRCGFTSIGDFHRGLLHFPQIKKLSDKFVASFKCPYCNRKTVYAVCPKCQKHIHVYKLVKVENKGKLWKLLLVCPYCGHREAVEYTLAPIDVV